MGLQVGQPRCKTLARFDQLMQCLDNDQPGATVETKKIFEEDREFNQGLLPPPQLRRIHACPRASVMMTARVLDPPSHHGAAGIGWGHSVVQLCCQLLMQMQQNPAHKQLALACAGEFAEQIREQWLQERIEYFSELEQAIFDEALGEDECTRPHVQAALQKLNPDLKEDKVQAPLAPMLSVSGTLASLVLCRMHVPPRAERPAAAPPQPQGGQGTASCSAHARCSRPSAPCVSCRMHTEAGLPAAPHGQGTLSVADDSTAHCLWLTAADRGCHDEATLAVLGWGADPGHGGPGVHGRCTEAHREAGHEAAQGHSGAHARGGQDLCPGQGEPPCCFTGAQ